MILPLKIQFLKNSIIAKINLIVLVRNFYFILKSRGAKTQLINFYVKYYLLNSSV